MVVELQETKSSFKLIGKVTRIDKDGAFREDVSTKGKKKGETYRSLKFGVKTSENNEIFVQMFDFEPTEVFLWNSDKAKEAKEKKKKYKGKKVEFQEWLDNEEEYREQGYAVLQSRIGVTHDDDGKLISRGLPSYISSEEIFNHLDNGDSVVIEGKIRYSTYTNRQEKEVEQKTYTIEKLHKLKDIDFEDEKFQEVSYFEQEMVFVDALPDKKEGKVYVTGRIIDYYQNWHDTQMVIKYKDENGEDDKDMIQLASAFASKVKFGDVVKVFGDTLNKVEFAKVGSDSDEEDDALALLGGKQKPSHANSNKTYITEFQIHGVEAWDKKVYTEDDFVKDELIVEEEDDDLLAKPNKQKGSNPFDDDSDDSNDEDDDLPF